MKKILVTIVSGLCIAMLCSCQDNASDKKTDTKKETPSPTVASALLNPKGKLTAIEAKYYGEYKDGVVIDNSSNIVLTVTYENGDFDYVGNGWSITNPSPLVAGETKTYEIVYQNLKYNLNITAMENVVPSEKTPTPSVKPVATEKPSNMQSNIQKTQESETSASQENEQSYTPIQQPSDSDSSNTLTTGQKNALSTAKSYLSCSAFSYQGLVSQLEYEKYSHEDAVYGADNCGADWNEQAAKSAASYLGSSAFSRDSLIEQLEYEGFTHEQAVYGVGANGY